MKIDNLTRQQRRKTMSRIRSKNTKPEMAVRSYLHRQGFRFRLHRRDLPGCPDLVLPKYKTGIFVHGCFWHQHEQCRYAVLPKTRTEYWIPKLKGNVDRFAQDKKRLNEMGWHVMVVWECQLRNSHFEATCQELVRKLRTIRS
jgi:DNA mismatch endonuclease (patch repair protein)